MDLKAGVRLRSAAGTTEVIVVRPPSDAVDLRCGGHPMVALGDAFDEADVDPAHADGTELGKRYADAETGIELLCTKAGDGSLSVDGRAIGLKDAKALPSSD